MSFLRKIVSSVSGAVVSVTTALFNVGVQMYRNIVGRPSSVVKNVIQSKSTIDGGESMLSSVPPDYIPLIGSPADKLKQMIEAIEATKIIDMAMIVVVYYGSGKTNSIPFTLATKRKQIKELGRMVEFLTDYDPIEVVGSDPIDVVGSTIESAIGFKIDQLDLLPSSNKTKVGTGGFFKHIHLFNDNGVTGLLKTLGIYDSEYILDDKQTNEPIYTRCLVTAMEGQLPRSQWDHLNSLIKTDFVSQDALLKIAKSLKKSIKLICEDNRGKRRVRIYNGEKITNEVCDITICLLDDHYFKYIENTGITKFYVENFDKVPKCPNKSRITSIKSDGTPTFTNVNFLNSFDLVRTMLKNPNCLEPLDVVNILSHPDNYKLDKLYSVNEKIDIENSCSAICPSSGDKINDFFVLDYETYPDETGLHQPYACSVYGKVNGDEIEKSFMIDLSDKKSKTTDLSIKMTIDAFVFIADNCGFISDWKNQIPVFCHNVTYDISFILNHPRFVKSSPLINNGKIVSCSTTFLYGNRLSRKAYFKFKDSLRLLPMKLSKIPSTLGIEGVKKEAMIYSVYNNDTIRESNKISKKVIDQHIKTFINNAADKDAAKEVCDQFWNNLQDYKNGDGYNLMKYALFYCEQDCKVVYQGLHKFNEIFKQIDDRMPNIWNFYSLPSIAQYYFWLNGCYEGCVNFNGLLGSYFQQFVVGGRCMLKDNKPQIKVGEIDDFDACSLYPSAMKFFDGFLIGEPKIWKSDVDLKSVDYYFLRVKITKVNKDRHFPVVSYVEDGKRNWSNDLVGKIIPLDKVGLEDAVEFQGIEYEIVDGYCFDQGFNKTINKVIENIYNRRVVEKKKGNKGLQEVLKLLMNSSYGKLIQKLNDCDSKIIQGYQNKRAYAKRRHHYIKSIESIGKDLEDNSTRYIIKEYKPIVESTSAPHLGSQILSYSKRIMNEVICTAEDFDLDIYYQDTDSLHIDKTSVNILEDVYNKKYKRELIGENLGQFHSDFDVEGLDKKTTYSSMFIGVMKKTYVDICVDVTGKKGHHMRAKGFPSSVLEIGCKEIGLDVPEMYLALLDGKSFVFDLLADNACRFEKSNGFQHTTKTKFTRELSVATLKDQVYD